MLTQQRGDPRNVLAAVAELAAATGVDGMVGGQYLDVARATAADDTDAALRLRRTHELKTGRLIGASVECVLLIAGMNGLQTTDYRDFASELGVLFQIVDDILDVTGTDAALGKPQGSDERQGKRTYVTEFGLQGAREHGGQIARQGPRLACRRRARRRTGARADHRLHLHPQLMSHLHRINRPQDLHALSEEELKAVAQEVREHIIDTVGEIGGHFGANLGTCELAVALHSLLDSPRDKILWDVGHQAYPHKILTGRRDELATIRKYGGLAPFCAIGESEHDIMGAGHASTSIGYAVGLKEGMKILGHADEGKVVAVIGDGSMTGGVAFEAIHQAGGQGTPIVVVLNDNGMSISPNVGAMSRYFNRVRLNPKLWHTRESVEERLSDLPGIGPAFERLGPQLKESIKAFWAPGLFWEELDWAYVGVIDGHDIRALRARAARCLRGRAPGRRARRDGQGQGLRPRRGGRPGGHGALARRQAEVDRQRHRRAGAAAAASPSRRRSTRRSSARRCWRSAGATRASSASPPR